MTGKVILLSKWLIAISLLFTGILSVDINAKEIRQNAELEEKFKNFTHSQKKKILENFKEYKQLSAMDKNNIKEIWHECKSLNQEGKKFLHQNYKKWQNFNPKKRKEYKQRFKKWNNLSQEKREKIKKQYMGKKGLYKKYELHNDIKEHFKEYKNDKKAYKKEKKVRKKEFRNKVADHSKNGIKPQNKYRHKKIGFQDN